MVEDVSYFARWAVPSIRAVRNPEVYANYSSTSSPLHHPGAIEEKSEATVERSTVTCFQSVCWDPPTANTTANKKQKTSHHRRDFLCNVGGAVWSLDWCPMTGNENGPELLVVGAHPAGHTKSVINSPVHGPAMLQLWSVPPSIASACSSDKQLPALDMCICHEGGLTWECKWCPQDASAHPPASHIPQSSSLPRLGLLAAVLGNGDINILAVPQPSAARKHLNSTTASETMGVGSANAPLFLDVPPVAWLGSGCLGSSLPCTVEWLPALPHDLLLVGCWDGTVAVVRLQPSATPGNGQSTRDMGSQQAQSDSPLQHDMVVLTHFQADPLPIRAIAWCPSQGGEEDGMEHRHLFLTAGHLGALRMWDSRDPCKPIYQRRISSVSRLLTLQWSTLLDPPGILVGADDGLLVYEATHPQDEGQTWQEAHLWRQEGDKGGHGTRSISREFKGTNSGAIWSIHCCNNGMVAYTGEAGKVAIFKERMLQDNRMRRAHTAVAGIQVVQDGKGLELRSAEYYTRHESGLYTGSKPGKGRGLPHETQSINRVRWSPNGGEAAWLAHGGAAGIVWLQQLSLR